MPDRFNIIIPVVKVDEAQRLVYGIMTEEVVDQAGEILDYDSSAPYFKAWSERIAKATGGKSVGNMRLMHQPIVAGKLTEIDFADEDKRISCCGKVVDDESWKLVLEGCLTGFSFGGNYVRRWKDPDNKKVTRFTAKPVEVSIVDNPCLQTATFEYVKADGTTEIRKFHDEGDELMPSQEDIARKAAELAAAAGTPDAVDQFTDEARTLLEGEAEAEKAGKPKKGEGEDDDEGGEKPAGEDGGEEAAAEEGEEDESEKAARIEAERADAATKLTQVWQLPADQTFATKKDAGAALAQVWQAPDGTTFANKDAAIDHVLGIEPEESAVDKALREAREAAGTVAEPADGDEMAKLAADLDAAHKGLVAANEHLAPLTKGLYEVRELASLVQQMSYIVSCSRSEALAEADGSPVPEQLFTAIRQMGSALIAMCQEEVAEMLIMLGAGSDWADAAVPISADVVAIVELAAMADTVRADETLMAKVGARNSRSDAAKLQTIHDHVVDLGAECAGEKAAKAAGGAGDDDEGEVIKTLRAENERLNGEVEKAVAGIESLGTEMAAMREKLEKIGKTPEPLPPKASHVVVERGGRSEMITQESLEKMSDAERADLAIRISQMTPLAKIGG